MPTPQPAPPRPYRLSTAHACPACLRPRSLTTDEARPIGARSAFIRAQKVERTYVTQLRKIARHVGDIVRGFDVQDLPAAQRVQALLDRYATTLAPWAEAVAKRMVTEVAARDERAWFRVAQMMGTGLKREIAQAPTGAVMRARMAEQVTLITSLPTEAGQRVHDLTIAGISEGRRAADIAAEIQRTGEVTESRAMLIARTEVSRTATELTKARAEHIGSTHFIWRTAGDSDVRATHKALNGQTFRWDEPPECDPGHHALPGGIWNCRCYAEPVIPDL
ncbi:phage minor head protein [Methylobacterium sp. B1]|uniref:phage head morphogenesis protein n=1 Tax=Methylobacterium sp. B1 TaxID=91459 RepID=UPI0009FE8B13|nr:phage minor head protein [Methylobacterium sp. B1]